MPIIQKKNAQEDGDLIDVGLGMMLLLEEMRHHSTAIEQSFGIYEWFLRRFMATKSLVNIWQLVPPQGMNPSLLKLAVRSLSSLHPDLFKLYPLQVPDVGIMDVPGLQIIVIVACFLNPKLAEALSLHVGSLDPSSGDAPLSTSILDGLSLKPARKSTAVGVYCLKWPTGQYTIGMTGVSFHYRLDRKRYKSVSGAVDDRVGRVDRILFDVSSLSVKVLGWGRVFAYALETFGISVFDTTNPSVGRNTNKADRHIPGLCLPDSLWPDVWGRLLELSERGIYMPRIRKDERDAKAIDRARFVQIPNTFAHFRTLFLQDVWPISTGDFLLYTYLTCMVMLTYHGKYTRFPPLPLHAQTRHKGWRPPLPGQHLSFVMSKVARKLDRLEGRRVYSGVNGPAPDSETDAESDEDGEEVVWESEDEEREDGEAEDDPLPQATQTEDVYMGSD